MKSDSASVRPVFLLALALAATFFVYSGALGFEFVWDDQAQILRNPLIRSFHYLPVYFRIHVWSHIAPADLGNYYRPLFLVWLLLNYKLFGANPMGWHLTTILSHLAATGMVYFTARWLTRDWRASMLAALVFGIHPVHIEAVAWVSGVTEPMLALFFLGAFLAYARARELRSLTWWAVALALYTGAMLSKETALIFPVFVAIYEWIYQPSAKALTPAGSEGVSWARMRAALLACTPFLLLTAFYFPVRIHVLHGFSHPVTNVPFLTSLLTFPSLLWFYAKILLYPLGLSVFYDTPYVTSFGLSTVAFPLLAVGVIAAGLCWWWRRTGEPAILYASAMLVLPLLPLFNLSTFQGGEIAHDRYLYLPSVGFSILVGLGLVALARTRVLQSGIAARALALGLLIAFLAGATIIQTLNWANNLVLYFHGTQVAPGNNLARVNLANELLERGMSQQALALYNQVLARDPNYWLCIYNIGYLDFRLGRYRDAEHFLTRAALMNSRDADSTYYLGLTERKLGKLDEAVMALQAALRREPRGRGYRYSLGLVFEEQGKPAEALQMFEDELKHNPQYSEPKVHIAVLRKQLGTEK